MNSTEKSFIRATVNDAPYMGPPIRVAKESIPVAGTKFADSYNYKYMC